MLQPRAGDRCVEVLGEFGVILTLGTDKQVILGISAVLFVLIVEIAVQRKADVVAKDASHEYFELDVERERGSLGTPHVV